MCVVFLQLVFHTDFTWIWFHHIVFRFDHLFTFFSLLPSSSTHWMFCYSLNIIECNKVLRLLSSIEANLIDAYLPSRLNIICIPFEDFNRPCQRFLYLFFLSSSNSNFDRCLHVTFVNDYHEHFCVTKYTEEKTAEA